MKVLISTRRVDRIFSRRRGRFYIDDNIMNIMKYNFMLFKLYTLGSELKTRSEVTLSIIFLLNL